MPSTNQARRYLWTLLGVTAGAILAIAALNFTADPFCVFGTPRRAGLNDRIPNTSGFDRMAKPYEILRVQPRTALLGSSTAHSGFRPLAEWETALPRPAYNYALLGASFHEVRLSLTHALRECPVETVIMVADFFAFNVHYPDNERFSTGRLLAATHRSWPGFLGSDLAAFAIGKDALGFSWKTISASRNAPRSASASSAQLQDYPWREHFRNCERSYLQKWFPPPSRAYEFTSLQSGFDRLADYDAALRLCAERGVRLIVICPPTHVRFQEALASAGAWQYCENWKRELAARTRVQQGRSVPHGSVELWDFGLFNDTTAEPVPAAGAGSMRYFFDSAHFTPEFGRLVLDEILGAAPPDAPHRGVRLDQVGIESHLANQRAALRDFRAANPGVVADVRAGLGLGEDANIPPVASR